MMELIPELPASGDLDEPAMIGTVTARGLHEFVASQLSRYARPGARAVDLGAGPGAMCKRLSSLGCQVLAIDRDQAVFEGKNRFVVQDIANDDINGLAFVAMAATGGAIIVAILDNWQNGVYFFLAWLLFEDLARKFPGNNMAIYFAKDFLVAIVYMSFFIAYRRKDKDLQVLRPPLFRLSKLAHAAQLAHAEQMTTALASQSSHPGTH
jgi:SAM-dependent methyltransferase